MSSFRILYIAVLVILAGCGQITIEANPGEYELLEYSLVKDEVGYEVEMVMLEVKRHEKWMPFLAFGLGDIKTKNKVELYLQKPTNEVDWLVAGCRYVIGGEVKENKVLMTKIPVGETINWRVTWDNSGNFDISVMGLAESTLETNLSNMVGFVKVSTAKGKIHRHGVIH